jgi:ferric-dicitrate binding protein FerR (iron transport regulator)
MTGRQEELIAGWLDASLTPDEQAELLAALKADEGFVGEFAREVEIHRGLQFAASQSAEGDRRAADRILHYVRASHEGTKFAENVKHRARAATHRGTSMVGPVIAIAAVLMVAVMVGLLAFVQYRHRMASRAEVAETPKPVPPEPPVAPTPTPPAPTPKVEDESERRKRIEEELRTAVGTKRESPPKAEEPQAPAPQVPAPQPKEEPVVKPAPTKVESSPVLAWLDGAELRDGATVESAGVALVRFADGTRVEISGEAKLHEKVTGKRAAGKGVTLARGSLTADVAKQPAGQAFLFMTPHAEVQVLGTKLSIASGAETRVDVQEGQVRVANLKSGQAVTLAAGQGTEVGPSGAPRSFLQGLHAVYFDQNNFKGAAIERVEAGIDLFLDHAKNDVPPVGSDRNFAVRWEGRFLAEAAGEYVFLLSVDGQAKFTLDGQELVADPRGVFHPIARSVVRRKLAPGWHDLVLEYTDDQGSSRCQLRFVPPGETLQADNSGFAIPSRLFTHNRR